MKIKPVVYDCIKTVHTSYELDFKTESNITFVHGDSGTGKSTVFSFLQELAAQDRKIRCFNYLDMNRNYKASIKNSKGKLFVIDNADIMLDDRMRRYISMDAENQYLLFGRNPTGLLLGWDNVYELESSTDDGRTKFTLVKSI